MTDLAHSGNFEGLPAIADRSTASGVPFEPEWHHITAAILDLPDDQRYTFVRRIRTAEDDDPRIPDVLDALSGYASLRPSPQAIFRSTIDRTDTTPGGYVRSRDIATDLGRAGFQFERFRSNVDQIISPGQEVVAGNLVSESGIGRSYRLVNPANARMLRNGSLELPDEMREEVQALQLAYRAFRLVAPNQDGSGVVHKSEVASALYANFGHALPSLANEVVSKVGLALGDSTAPESIARVAINRLSEHPLFEVSSLRYGSDRRLRLRPDALPVQL